MKRRRLGRTALEVTELGFGGAPLGGLYAAVTDANADAALAAGWAAGIRSFDTAPLYGAGLSEQRLGAFLATKPRDSFVLSTKVGRTLRPSRLTPDARATSTNYVGALANDVVFDFSAGAVTASIEDSLRRLGLARIDILYIHDPDEHFEQAVRETYPALRALREAGTIGAIGIGMNYVAPLIEFVRRCDIDVIMLAGRYTLLDRTGAGRLLPLCAERGVAVMAAGIFNSGILSSASPLPGATFDYAPASADIRARVERMARICERYGTELPAAALQFPLAHRQIAGTVVGMRSVDEVRTNVSRSRAALPPEVWAELAGEALYDAPAR